VVVYGWVCWIGSWVGDRYSVDRSGVLLKSHSSASGAMDADAVWAITPLALER
jgi:hypothetical protein